MSVFDDFKRTAPFDGENKSKDFEGISDGVK